MAVIIGILIVLALLVLLAMLAGVLLYRHNFRGRFDGGSDYFPYFSSLHPGWKRESVSFVSSRGDTLRGYVFSYDGPAKALIVVFHGFGMSLSDYLPECEYFCRRGYRVLAFDGNGTGISDGKLYGLPQHVIDLSSCLSYIASTPELSALPLLLYGHSWGGYSADCVSRMGDFPIRGVISASAFATSTSAFTPYMARHWGQTATLPLVGVKLYQLLLFGRAARITSVMGLKALHAPVLILQSDDDKILPFAENYEVLLRAFRDDPQKTFLPLIGHNHNITTPPDVDRRKRQLLPALRSGTATPEQLREMDELKAVVDTELLKTFADFFDRCIADKGGG